MALPLILARTFKEAHAYAKDKLDLRIGHYRVVNSPGTIKAVRNTDLHLVPGWTKRPDRFTMQSAIRYCHLTIVDPTKEPAGPAFECRLCEYVSDEAGDTHAHPAAPAPTPPNDGTEADDPVGGFFDNATLDAAIEENLFTDKDLAQSAGETRPPAFPVDPEVATGLDAIVEPESKKRRRRIRCKECEQLHFKGDPCVDSEAI